MRLIAARHRLAEDPAGRGRRKLVNRLLAHACELTELGKAPVVHQARPVRPELHAKLLADKIGNNLAGSEPHVRRFVALHARQKLLSAASDSKTFVRTASKQFPRCAGKILLVHLGKAFRN